MRLNGFKSWALLGIAGYLTLLLGCQPATVPQGEQVKVARVVSGQTLEILDPTGQTALTERVRLLGINTPDWHQRPWSTDAKARLESFLGEDKVVVLELDIEPSVEKDGSKLRLAYVWKNRHLLNEQLIAAGYALAESRSPNTKYEQRLAHAQEKARLLGLGIWSPENPMRQTPEEFRAKGGGREGG